MKITIKGKKQCKTSEWSGGTTTELYIYPEDGDYAARNFQVRISTATVDVEESKFTSLEGVERYLMILDGEMKLVHEGRSEREMKPFCDIENFRGNWETTSYGKVTDYNLMLKGGAKGKMLYAEAEKGESITLPMTQRANARTGIYVVSGKGKLGKMAGQPFEESQFILLERWQEKVCCFENTGEESLRLAICQFTV